MIYLDTSVLVATALTMHPHHAASLRLCEQTKGQATAISTHTIAEMFSILTSLPQPMRTAPRKAVWVVETNLSRMTAVTLTGAEYLETLYLVANLGHSGGMIYDALHIACARKVKAERIYTWNVRHFRSLAADLADRIVSP